MTKDDLLPCPFCGHAEVTVHEGSTFRWRYAACDNCGAQSCEIRIQTLGDGTKEEWEEQARIDAITEWNTRAVQVEVRKVNAGRDEADRRAGANARNEPSPAAAPLHWDAHGNSGMRFPEEGDLVGGETDAASEARNPLADDIARYLRQLAPHAKDRDAGRLLLRAQDALRQQAGAGKASISEFEQIVKDESAQWKGVGDDTHGAQTACQMILQKIAALKERT